MITQSAVTVMADVLDGRESALQQLLEQAGRDPANNALVPFGRFSNVHFARFFILPGSRNPIDGQVYTPRLLFLADVDGPAAPFLESLATLAGDGLDAFYRNCRGYPGRQALLDFLKSHTLPPAAKYINTIGRTVDQIRHEAELHDALQAFLDRTADQWRGASARRVRAAIQEFVESEPRLAWARHPVTPPEPSYVFGEKLHMALVGIAVTVLFPVILIGLPFWAYFLRQHEQTDIARDVAPSDAWRAALAAQEDHGIQNPYSSAGFVKPGPFRRFTGTVVLWGTNFLTRHIFNHADLIGVKTIHCARWVFIDQKRRLFFASNYDGSLENYMDDFVDKIAWALNTAFSSGVDYPRTNWLMKDGAHDEQVFKRFNIMHQLVAPFWYAGYQGLTALNIDNNAAIRAGLFGSMDEAAARAWLRRFG
jgi:hypothetical protein